MRKFALAGLALVLSVGMTLAADVVFLGYDKEKKELKVKESGDEKVYTVSDKTVFKFSAKGEDKELPNDKGIEQLEKMDGNEKQKGKARMDIEVDGKKVKEVKFKRGGKKQDK
jgi:hypothetical protein